MTGYWQGDLLSEMYGKICRAKVFGKGNQRPKVGKGYSASVVKLKLMPELANYPQWMDYIQEYLYARMEAGMIKIHSEYSWLADLAGSIEDEELREEYVINSLRLDILRGYLHGVEKRIESVRLWIHKKENLKLLEEFPAQIAKERKRYEKAPEGADLSEHSFVDAAGKQVALGDFKGKYVFIDIWSTGCNPCVGEIPYLRDMEHRFVGKPIVWVSLSMDTKKDVWLDFLKKNDMKGVQLLCNGGFKHPFCQQIGLGGIPHFLLLDKEGKVVDAHTLRPSNPVLGKLLEFLLK